MSFTTIYRTARKNRVLLIKSILEQHHIKYRIINESNPADFTTEFKIQVQEENSSRAFKLLKENGFLSLPSGGDDAFSMSKYWLWLVITIFALIVASFLINLVWRG